MSVLVDLAVLVFRERSLGTTIRIGSGWAFYEGEGSSCGFREVPRHERVEVLITVTGGELFERDGKPGERIDIIHAASLHERADDRPGARTFGTAGEQRVFAGNDLGLERALDNVGVELDAAIIDEPGQPLPTVEDVADRLSHIALGAVTTAVLLEERAQLGEHGTDRLLPDCDPLGGRTATDHAVDMVDRGDAAQRFVGERILAPELDKAAAGMRPAIGQADRIAPAKLVVSRVAVDLQHAGKSGEMLERSLLTAIGLVDIGDRRRIAAAPGSIVAGIGPELAARDLPGREHRHDRLVGKQLGRTPEMRHQMPMERPHPPGHPAHPVADRGAVETDALAREDRELAVDRRMIGVLANRNPGEQRFGRQAAIDDVVGRRRLDDARLIAAAAAIARATGDSHAELDRHDVEPLGDMLVDDVQITAAAGAGLILDVDDALDPLEMRRQMPEVLAALRFGARISPVDRRIERGVGSTKRDLDILEEQRELVGIERLGALAEAVTLEGGENLGEPLHLVPKGGVLVGIFCGAGDGGVALGCDAGGLKVTIRGLGGQLRDQRMCRRKVIGKGRVQLHEPYRIISVTTRPAWQNRVGATISRTVESLDFRWNYPSRRTLPAPVHAGHKRRQLHGGDAECAIGRLGPCKALRILRALGHQPYPSAIEPQDLQPIQPLRFIMHHSSTDRAGALVYHIDNLRKNQIFGL